MSIRRRCYVSRETQRFAASHAMAPAGASPSRDAADDPPADPYAAHELPVSRYAGEIVAAVRENPVVVVIGETGSGKTTQMAQILHRAGLMPRPDMGVAVTQPRRVAAVSVARRVAHEMGVRVGGLVGYTVRFEDCSSPATRVKYLTDGTLLRELLQDPTLRRYGVVVLDEAHERSLNTDILFGLLKSLVRVRRPDPLRLVVTSATLESERFSAYFGDCPVYHVPGRVYPVQIAYAAEQPRSYFETAIETVYDIHRSQGEGDVLLFLTGKEEIERACRALNDRVRAASEDECGDAQVLPLYAALPPEQQARVFSPPPPGCRRVVVATNVAETSLTVPGIAFVVDPGMVKLKRHDARTGMETLEVTPISATQAKQRAGRAGRTRAGRCFRLYTRDAFERDMPVITQPEILRTDLASTVLYLKTLRLESLDVASFDFLDTPGAEAIGEALRQLYVLGAIDADGEATPVGREMSPMPVEPRLARAMLEARRLGCVAEMAVVAAMLSVERVYVGRGGADRGADRGAEMGADRGAGRRPPDFATPEERAAGDHVVLLRAFQAWDASPRRRDFAEAHGLNERGMEFARDVRKQLLAAFRDGSSRDRGRDRGRDRDRDRSPDRTGNRGGSRDRRRSRSPRSRSRSRSREGRAGGDALTNLRRAVCVGFADRLARRLPNHNGFRTFGVDSVTAEVHPSSARDIADEQSGLLPEWIAYHELVTTSRPFLRNVCRVESAWVAPIVHRLTGVDVRRLSGGALAGKKSGADPGGDARGEQSAGGGGDSGARKNDDTAVEEARARYLARKMKAGKGTK